MVSRRILVVGGVQHSLSDVAYVTTCSDSVARATRQTQRNCISAAAYSTLVFLLLTSVTCTEGLVTRGVNEDSCCLLLFDKALQCFVSSLDHLYTFKMCLQDSVLSGICDSRKYGEHLDKSSPQFLALRALGLFMVILPSPFSVLTSRVSSLDVVVKLFHARLCTAARRRSLASDPGVVVHLERLCKPLANLMAAPVIQWGICKFKMHATACCDGKKQRDVQCAT